MHGYVTTRSDIYAAGPTLWVLLAGTHPLASHTRLDELTTSVAEGITIWLRDVAPHVSAPLARAVKRAIALDPAARYSSAVEFDSALAKLPPAERTWTPALPPDGAERRWVGADSSGGKVIEVLAHRQSGRRIRVETTYVASGRRVRSACFEATDGQLARQLRKRVFDALG